VLFSVASMPAYGALSKRKLEDQQAGARVAIEAHKKNPADFVLWKESSADQPGWEGHFDADGQHHLIHGRPGWHIECSVMAKDRLGEVFDIHGGGLDLIFPHHENEIAQSRCAHGTERMANYWMHNGFLQVEGKKMAKSEGNFVTIHDLLHTEKFGGRRWPGEVLRLAMLMTHYREPIDFSVRRLEEAEANLLRWERQVREYVLLRTTAEFYSGVVSGTLNLAQNDNLGFAIRDLFADDLNIPLVITQLRGMSADIEHASTEHKKRDLSYEMLGILVFLGIWTVEGLQRGASLDDETSEIILRRLAFIRDKNFAEADRIRDQLLVQGIQLKDGKDPETGERVTTWEVKR
jgi:cysteinyl-tRNA synthetase